MFRKFAVAAILVLAVSSAQAEDSLTTRIYDAAMKACAAKVGDNLPISYYRALIAPLRGQCEATAAMASMHAREVAESRHVDRREQLTRLLHYRCVPSVSEGTPMGFRPAADPQAARMGRSAPSCDWFRP